MRKLWMLSLEARVVMVKKPGCWPLKRMTYEPTALPASKMPICSDDASP